mmetsp:Transcript_30019/g.42201  ORF Transcript_30019/g.42201 Transcript_30019/m.42201 type:complete len:248 (-) Transcript_30019:553-1296(-)
MLKISKTSQRTLFHLRHVRLNSHQPWSFERSVHMRSGDLHLLPLKSNNITHVQLGHQHTIRQNIGATIQRHSVAIKNRMYCTQKVSDQQEQVPQEDKIPKEALTLGVAGLIPFVSGAVGVVSLPLAWGGYVAFLQMTYGASILSFLGAVHWGFAATKYTSSQDVIRTNTHNWMQYGFGVVPSLISWASMTQSPLEGMALLLAGHTLALMGDLYAAKRGLTPSWYPRLRFPLYVGVMASLGTTFMRVL